MKFSLNLLKWFFFLAKEKSITFASNPYSFYVNPHSSPGENYIFRLSSLSHNYVILGKLGDRTVTRERICSF